MFARLGRWCFDRRRWVLLTWAVTATLGVVAAPTVFSSLSGGFGGSDQMESIRAYNLIDEVATTGSRILVVVDAAPVADPDVAATVEGTAETISRLDGVAAVTTASQAPPEAGMVAEDGQAQLILVDLETHVVDEDAVLDQVSEAARSSLDALPAGSEVLLGGPLLVQREINEQVERDTRKGEALSLPVSLVVMIAVFGGFLAALLPVAGAVAATTAGFLVLLGLLQVVELDSNVVPVTTVLALGLAIDYALLMVSRFREERGNGHDVREAVGHMSAAAGRTIVFSAVTVAISLGGLLVFDSSIYRAIGTAGVSVVVLAMVAALTLVPALLGFFGHRISAPSEPLPDDGRFARLARRVQRHPALWVVALVGFFVVAGLPFWRIEFGLGGSSLLPAGFESRQVDETLRERFPGREVQPVLVVARTSAEELTGYAAEVAEWPEVSSVLPVVARGDAVSSVEVIPVNDDVAPDVVEDLRADDPGFVTYVTGNEAVLIDFVDELRSNAPWALALICLATFVLLFLMTGSVLVPLKALVMNVLSLSATFGVLVLVFQDGRLSDALGFTPTGTIETFIPVIVFAFAFGLSMDYEVFLLARIKELYDRGRSNDDAVALGLQRSGKIITSAALIMVLVFAGFASGQMLGIKQMGVALAVAVALDATVVRMLLVPATMSLLGDRNWWAPAPLRRLHDALNARVDLRH